MVKWEARVREDDPQLYNSRGPVETQSVNPDVAILLLRLWRYKKAAFGKYGSYSDLSAILPGVC